MGVGKALVEQTWARPMAPRKPRASRLREARGPLSVGRSLAFPLAKLHPMAPPPRESAAAQLLERAAPPGANLSACVPLVWVPTWAFSFADSFVSSLLPIDELQNAGLIDDSCFVNLSVVRVSS